MRDTHNNFQLFRNMPQKSSSYIFISAHLYNIHTQYNIKYPSSNIVLRIPRLKEQLNKTEHDNWAHRDNDNT